MALTIGLIALALVAGGLLLASVWSRRAPELGVRDGALADCPDRPNCVCSQARDPSRRVEPLVVTGEPHAAFARARAEVLAMARTEIIDESPGYLRAEVRSRMFRFVDDLELLLDPGGTVIHVRSASRVGYSDLGANRTRVEALRATLHVARAGD